MFYWSNTLNCVYVGTLQPGDRPATDAEIAAHTAPVVSTILYSKLKIVRALKTAGIWEDVKSAIEQAGAYDEWLVAQDLASDDPLFMQMQTLLAAQYPDIDLLELLANCKLSGVI